jgi:hypothetical protein
MAAPAPKARPTNDEICTNPPTAGRVCRDLNASDQYNGHTVTKRLHYYKAVTGRTSSRRVKAR